MRATKTNTDRLRNIRLKLTKHLKLHQRMGSGISWTWKIRKLRSGTVFSIMRTEIRVHGRVRLQTEMEPVPPMGLPRMMPPIITIFTVRENVFYSGVGHSTVDGDMEAKLFINTMIAAYRTTYEPPMVEILNEEAELLKRGVRKWK